MRKYQARRPTVQAMQYDGGNSERIAQWMRTDDLSEVLWPKRAILVPTEAGTARAFKGDWVVKFRNGTFQVMPDHEFEAEYEPVGPPA